MNTMEININLFLWVIGVLYILCWAIFFVYLYVICSSCKFKKKKCSKSTYKVYLVKFSKHNKQG